MAKDGATIVRTADADAREDFDAVETTRLLLERLQAWKHACVQLQNYIGAIERTQSAQAKAYETVLKTVWNPLKEGDHFGQSLGGLVGLFDTLRSNVQGISNLHLDTQTNLRDRVLPALEILHQEIKSKHKELSDGIGKSSKLAEKACVVTKKHVEILSQQIRSYEASAGKFDAESDPFVIQRGVYYRYKKQILEENKCRRELVDAQEAFPPFEAHVLSTFQQALDSFALYMGAQAEREQKLYVDVAAQARQIPADFEWKSFISQHDGVLLDPKARPKSMSDISFSYENHFATKPLIEGSLARKKSGIGALKGYITGHYVVTSCKFLHDFVENDNISKEAVPEFSLYLPDCVIGAVNGSRFSLKGKDASKNKAGTKALHISHELTFKAASQEEAHKWWNVIEEAAGCVTSEVPPMSPLSEPTSPIKVQNVNVVTVGQGSY